MSNCGPFRAALAAWPTDPMPADAANHAGTCDDCARAWGRARAVEAHLAAPMPPPPPDLADRVMARVREERRTTPFQEFLRLATASAAAAAILGAVLWLGYGAYAPDSEAVESFLESAQDSPRDIYDTFLGGAP